MPDVEPQEIEINFLNDPDLAAHRNSAKQFRDQAESYALVLGLGQVDKMITGTGGGNLPEPPPEGNGANYLDITTAIIYNWDGAAWTGYPWGQGSPGGVDLAQLTSEVDDNTQNITDLTSDLVATDGDVAALEVKVDGDGGATPGLLADVEDLEQRFDVLEGQLEGDIAGDVYYIWNEYLVANGIGSTSHPDAPGYLRQAYFDAWAADTSVVRWRNPNPSGVEFVYLLDQLCTITGAMAGSTKRMIIDDGIRIKMNTYTGVDPENEFKDSNDVNGVFGFANLHYLYIEGRGGIIDAQNSPGNIPLAGNSGVDDLTLNDGGSTFRRSHHGVHTKNCDYLTIKGINTTECWFGIQVKDCVDPVISDFKFLRSASDGNGARRVDDQNPGQYIGDYNNAALALGGTVTGAKILNGYAEDCSEVIDFNPTEIQPTISGVKGVNIYESVIEISGAEGSYIEDIVGINCAKVVAVEPYDPPNPTTTQFTSSVFRGVRAVYTEDAPDWIKSRAVVPITVQGTASVQAQVVLDENVNFVDMAAVFMEKDGQNTNANHGTLDVEVRCLSSSRFRGFDTTFGISVENRDKALESVYGHRGEIIYQKGGRANIWFNGFVSLDVPLVFSDGGITDIREAKNLFVSNGTGVPFAGGSANMECKVFVTPDHVGWDDEVEILAGAIVNPLYPIPEDNTSPLVRSGCKVAIFRDFLNVYDTTDEPLIHGLPGAGSYLSTRESFGNDSVSGNPGVYPLYSPGVGARFEVDTGMNFGSMTNILDWSTFRVSVAFQPTLLTTDVRRLVTFGGRNPFRLKITEDTISLETNQDHSVGSSNAGLSFDANTAISSPIWDVTKIYVVTVWFNGTSFGARLTWSTGVSTYSTYTQAGPTLDQAISSGAISTYNGELAVGSTDGGSDAGGEFILSGLLIGDGSEEVVTANMLSDEKYLIDTVKQRTQITTGGFKVI